MAEYPQLWTVASTTHGVAGQEMAPDSLQLIKIIRSIVLALAITYQWSAQLDRGEKQWQQFCEKIRISNQATGVGKLIRRFYGLPSENLWTPGVPHYSSSKMA